MPTFSPPETPPSPRSESPDSTSASRSKLSVLLLSADDGRNTLVDLTKTLAEMAQRGKIAPGDISAELIDAEISESVMDEPELLILFGDSVLLKGYPPWQIRLTEILYVSTYSRRPPKSLKSLVVDMHADFYLAMFQIINKE